MLKPETIRKRAIEKPDNWFSCYDFGDAVADRYTVVFKHSVVDWRGELYPAYAMDEKPFHPQGFGQFCEVKRGKHLGRKIKFNDLPPACQKLAWSLLPDA